MTIKKKKTKKGRNKIFSTAIKEATKVLKNAKPIDMKDAFQIAEKTLSPRLKRTNINMLPRIIRVPKVGGFLPLILILAGMAKLGGMVIGMSIANLIQNVISPKYKKPKKTVAIGNGLYLKPYRNECGFFLKPYSKN